MLQVTHTLTVNQAGANVLSLEQLWAGLLMRVTHPMLFTVGLDRVEMLKQNDVTYKRALYFGSHVVYDNVTCVPYESIEFVTEATDTMPSGHLIIRILGVEHLRLNFEYNTQFPEPKTDEEKQLLKMIKAAYLAADEDMVRIIREQRL